MIIKHIYSQCTQIIHHPKRWMSPFVWLVTSLYLLMRSNAGRLDCRLTDFTWSVRASVVICLSTVHWRYFFSLIMNHSALTCNYNYAWDMVINVLVLYVFRPYKWDQWVSSWQGRWFILRVFPENISVQSASSTVMHTMLMRLFRCLQIIWANPNKEKNELEKSPQADVIQNKYHKTECTVNEEVTLKVDLKHSVHPWLTLNM